MEFTFNRLFGFCRADNSYHSFQESSGRSFYVLS
jgi:hypothetical protein